MDSVLSANDILGYIQQVILSGKSDDLALMLDYIDLSNIDFQDGLRFIIGLLKLCHTYGNPKAGVLIYNIHKKIYTDDSNIGFMTILFLNQQTTAKLMQFLIYDCEIICTFMGTVKELIELTTQYTGSELSIAFNKCYQSFPRISVENLKELLIYARSQNDDISLELTKLVREKNEFADIPKWIINKGLLPKESFISTKNLEYAYDKSIVNVNDFIDDLIADVSIEIEGNGEMNCYETHGKRPADLIKDIVIGQYNALSLNQKYTILEKYINYIDNDSINKDASLFIRLGPTASIIGLEPDPINDRMFVLNNDVDEDRDDFELDDNGMPYVKDWFVGYCQECDLKIRRRWHAVRVPLKYGGWEGCMCSWKCVKRSIINFNNSDPVMLSLCDVYEKEIYNYGILDRIPDDEYDEYLKAVGVVPGLNEGIIGYLPDGTTLDNIKENINEEEYTLDEKRPILLLYFYEPDCDICKEFEPQLEQIVEYTTNETGTRKLVNIYKIDVTSDKYNDEYHIESVPTVIVYKNEIPVNVFIGNSIRPINLFIHDIITQT